MIIVTIRSHSRHDVGEQLRSIGKSLRQEDNLLTLGGLTFEQSRQLAAQVGAPEVSSHHALDALAQLGLDSPFFVVVGGQLLKQNRIKTPTLESSPELRREILAAFRTELMGGGTPADDEVRTEVLRAVAAMQPLRSDWPTFQESLASLVARSSGSSPQFCGSWRTPDCYIAKAPAIEWSRTCSATSSCRKHWYTTKPVSLRPMLRSSLQRWPTMHWNTH